MKTKENENTAEQDWSRISNSMTTSHWLSIEKYKERRDRIQNRPMVKPKRR